MSNTEFDKFFHDKLGDHISPVPPGMWERINPHAKRRPGIIWWKTSGLLVFALTLATAGFLFYPRLDNSGANDTPKLTNQRLHTKPSQLRTAAQGQQLPTSSNNLTEPMNPNTDPNRQVASASPVERNAPGTRPTPARGAVGISLKPGRIHYSRRLISEPKRQQQTELPLLFQSGMQSNTGNDIQLLSTVQVLMGSLADERQLLSVQRLALLSEEQQKYNPSCMVRCPTNSPARNRPVFIELYVSPDYANKRVIGRDSVSNEFLRRKDSSESFQSAFSAGFRLSKRIGNNMLVKAGVQYSQINEKFSFRSENERRSTMVITIRTVIRAPGDTILIRDTSNVEQVGYRITKHYNKYRSFDIPVSVSYEWGNDNIRMAVSGGVVFNLRSWQEGQMLNTSFVPEAINKTPGQVFKTNLGVGVFAGLSVFKRLSSNLGVFAEPYFRYNFSDMTTERFPFTQKFNVGGLNLGVRYKLTGRKPVFGR